jgi:DNA-nicking Smr family endonuclease
MDGQKNENGAVRIPIDGVLDLHMFSPRDAASVVDEYLRACVEQGIFEVRIVHGKGKGALRRTVHALLDRHPQVLSYGLDAGPSGWGATVVVMKRGPVAHGAGSKAQGQ